MFIYPMGLPYFSMAIIDESDETGRKILRAARRAASERFTPGSTGRARKRLRELFDSLGHRQPERTVDHADDLREVERGNWTGRDLGGGQRHRKRGRPRSSADAPDVRGGRIAIIL